METTTINHNLCNVQTKHKLSNNIFHNIFFIIYFFNIHTNHEDNKYKKNIKGSVIGIELSPYLERGISKSWQSVSIGWMVSRPPIQDSMLSSKSGEERYSGLHPPVHTMFTDCQILFYRQITNFSLHNFPYFLFLKLSHTLINRCYNWWR